MPGSAGARGWIVLLVLLVATVFAIRMAGPSDLEGDAQDRNIGYVMDVVWQGHWLVQTDIRGRIMSKPPLHTWVASSFAQIGGINRLTLSLPSALAVLGIALAVFFAGRQRFGMLAGGLAGLAVVLAPIMSRHIALVRTDALFALAIALAAFAAQRAWERGRGWTSFWLAAAAATLVKGPLGLILAGSGLLAWFWERRTDVAVAPLRGSHRTGIAVFLAITLGWLLLGVATEGFKLVDKLFFAELLGQATGMRKDSVPGENLYKPAFFFILRFLPFSLFACLGLWGVWRHPAADDATRRFERFLFCWLVVGVLIFSLAAHFRADLLLPLWAPAALLAGREMGRLAERWNIRRQLWGIAVMVVVMTGAMVWNYLVKEARLSKEVRYTQRAESAAHALLRSGLDVKRIHHLDTPVTLQLALGTFNVWIEEDEALRLVRSNERVWLAVEDPQDFRKLLAPDGPPLRKVLEVPGLTIFHNGTMP
jgi:4-amino-4-deoxy-L-arabinose transferase-like glycosyltransferase